MAAQAAAITLIRSTSAAILDLRWRVLREGLPRSSAEFPGDDAATTLHCAAVYQPNTSHAEMIIGCASWMLNHFDDVPAYQLRGMAVSPEFQGQGIGQRLLAFSEMELASTQISLRWCNARAKAIPFYERNGWIVVSDEFDIATAGPHRRMTFHSTRNGNISCKVQE
jgi:GNAT superfamily N-acetyltransferase